MIRGRHYPEDGLTGLELVLLIVIMVAAATLMLVFLSGSAPDLTRTFPGGVVSESLYISGDNLQTTSNVYGFPRVSRTTGMLPVAITREDPDRLGVVRTTIALFIGNTGAIDMDKVRVQWYSKGSTENILMVTTPVLVCPNWTISGKTNLLPGHKADSDDLLEPNEQFELTICPSEGIPPYGSFSLVLRPDGTAMPLTITRNAPARIQPVMNLG